MSGVRKGGYLAAVLFFGVTASTTFAASEPVGLFLDTAPNIYGSPDWLGFRDATFASIYSGTFVNQAHSTNSANVGTLNYEVTDYMVYSFGDLGKRLHAFYYIPNETTATLAGRFQVSMEYDFDGATHNPYAEVGWGDWVTPGSWVNYDGDHNGTIDGVIGSMGNALWGADGVNTQTALDADIADAELYLGNTRFMARLDGQVYELTAIHTPVPLPAAVWVGFAMLGGWGGLQSFKRRQRKVA